MKYTSRLLHIANQHREQAREARRVKPSSGGGSELLRLYTAWRDKAARTAETNAMASGAPERERGTTR